ncbi:MAG: hypothetical protein FJ405_10290 [Verrucomicrobia bacterium]|nr:hypothetical protein [Verrucomicrobiota bacterium]
MILHYNIELDSKGRVAPLSLYLWSPESVGNHLGENVPRDQVPPPTRRIFSQIRGSADEIWRSSSSSPAAYSLKPQVCSPPKRATNGFLIRFNRVRIHDP